MQALCRTGEATSLSGDDADLSDHVFQVHRGMVEEPERPGIVTSPVFLVASVRSGTTLLRLMLDHHPELAFFHEFQYAVEALPEEGLPDFREYYEYLRGHRIFQDSRLAVDTSLDYHRLMNSFLIQKRERDGKRLVGATVHIHFDRLLRIWPDARFIHLVRDGRDVARSRVELGWSGNMYTGVQSWIDAERLWEKVKSEVPASRRVEVAYEQLLTGPEAELTRICHFLDLDFHPAMLSYHRNSTYDTPDTKLIGQWRRKLSPRAIQLAEARIGDMLVDRGYELSGLDALHVGPLRERLVFAEDRWNRLNARRRVQGNSLFAAEFLLRAIDPVYRSLSRFRWQVLDRLNEVERSTLK